MKTIESLDGIWDFIADLDPKYHHQNLFDECGNLLIIAQKIPNYAKSNISRRYWKQVQVPGVWQKYGDRYDLFEGVCWFAREFQAERPADLNEAWLRLGAVNYKCHVFINDRFVGAHETGYTEFALEIKDYIRHGTNHIAVMVDNRATSTIWPPCLGYFNYGGIHRGVSLEWLCGPALHEPRLSSARTAQGWLLQVAGHCAGAGRGASVAVTCNERQAFAAVDEGGNYAVELLLTDVTPWSPENPQLYRVEAALSQNGRPCDRYESRFGFREIKVSDRQIHLNGNACRLQGICYVFDDPATGLQFTEQRIEEDLHNIKQMGCNTIRCHYAMDRMFYEACDRVGLLVWIEPNIYCYHPGEQETDTAFANPRSVRLAEQMIREMIRPAFNHPSVAIYGIGNECNANHPEAEPFFRRLSTLVRETDPNRIISYAALYGNVGPLATMIDVLGINSYWGWYDRIANAGPLTDMTFIELGVRQEQEQSPIDLQAMHEMLQKVIQNSHENLVLLLTEFGADSVPGYLSRSKDLWSEDYHAELLKDIFALTAHYSQIAGTFPFCYADYRDPSKESNGYWNEINLKGVVSYERRKKLSYYLVQQFYREAALQTSN